MAPSRQLVLSLHSQQGLIYDAGARYRVVAAGRRWGKTTLARAVLLSRVVRPGWYWYVAPTYGQARDLMWRELRAAVPADWLARQPNETRLEVELKGGVILALRGADDPDSLRGRGLQGIVLDEYADMDPMIWPEIIQPALMDTRGWALIIGTPRGYDHFYELYRRGQDPQEPEWQSWQFRSVDAPHLDAADLERARRITPPRIYRQEYEASFEAASGTILGHLWQERHVVGREDDVLLARGYALGQQIAWHVIDDPRWHPPEGALIYGSIDYGYGDPCSIHLHAALPGEHTRTFREFYSAEIHDVDQAWALRKMLESGPYHPEWIVFDPGMKGSRREVGLAKSIIEVYEDVLRPLGVQLVSGAGGRSARQSRPQRWMEALQTAADGLPHWSVTAACPHLIRTVPWVRWDEDDPEVEDGSMEQHAYEDTGRFFEARPHTPKVLPVDPLAHLRGDPISHAHQTAMAAKHDAKRRQVLNVKGLGLRG